MQGVLTRYQIWLFLLQNQKMTEGCRKWQKNYSI